MTGTDGMTGTPIARTYGDSALETTGLGVRYRRTWALRDCSLSIPAGRVVALVGPNGAGKSTFLRLAVGLVTPTRGSVRVFGEPIRQSAAALARVSFLAQDKPLYDGFTVTEMLRFGRHLNPGWDDDLARERLADLDIPLNRKVGTLSGGQQAQVALTVAVAKRPDLLVMDEPLANLDPAARHDVMSSLMAAVVETGMTVVLSSHVVPDLKDTCDWLVLLNRGQVQVSGDIDDLLAAHHVLSGPAGLADGVAARMPVISESRSDRQATLLVRTDGRTPSHDPRWSARGVTLEELVVAYLRSPDDAALPRPALALS
ncbi:ABC-2 type transport system ATP-binding protein [Nonomuraea solani]|uniref:ABC-2 type transport system ATP-binding protein n=1 Tax=Nonomuraea solani TaxID=1144553 RepID=A0A1H6EZC1_9ACTN|nr:ABC transporter ATP-binding protein [Nonomuraea solani]SEH03248.1 ABC-2 type transport system ATP-binding protein [Nonomuraea solani]